ncbi:uncharacterized protein YcbK (DUF882 family) [Azospirillum brasilense]|uniref:Murein endopeptidase K n=1 Tax=Azospirillum brasilense TaxID=192 RepID=A0A560CHB1_AZOBR|nr:DUF882 domain-containing protein [Azospirillum brasilense]TWA84256.1 uncharacterized protein YcbK (DUF882 family) [Azospirillum brasilense]
MRHLLRLSLLGLLAGGTLAGCASTPGPQASFDGGPRSITLHHPASGETVSVTYRRADGYDPQALDRIATLFRDRRTGETVPVDPTLVELLADLRDRCGAGPDTPVHITSGYRSPLTNVTLARSNPNVAENSYHLRGQAADISIPGVPPRRLADEAAALQRGGYALYPHTGHVHVDTGPVRTWSPKGGDPRILEARAKAASGKAVAAKASPAPRTQVAAAEPAPAKRPPAKTAPAAAPAKGNDADLARVRMVLASLKEQPDASAKKKP